MDLKECEGAGFSPAQHWYYRTKRIPLIEYFDKQVPPPEMANVVDIGAGSGFFSECLMDHAGARIMNAHRVDTGYLAETVVADSRISGELVSSRSLPAQMRGAFILMMDVLEHVDDDAAFLGNVIRNCAGQNRIFITVPAFQSLWSPHDEFLGHRRRYTLYELRSLARNAGIKEISAYYIYGLIWPVVWISRRWKKMSGVAGSDMKRAGRISGILLEWACRAEFLFRKWNTIGGVTCVLEGAVHRP